MAVAATALVEVLLGIDVVAAVLEVVDMLLDIAILVALVLVTAEDGLLTYIETEVTLPEAIAVEL